MKKNKDCLEKLNPLWEQDFEKSAPEENGEQILLYKHEGELSPEFCPHHVPYSAILPGDTTFISGHIKRPPELKYKMLYEALKNNKITDDVILHTADTALSARPIIATLYDKRPSRYWVGHCKGDRWYSTKYSIEIEQAAKALSNKNGTTYALTITAPGDDFTTDKIALNKRMFESWGYWIDRVRKLGKCYYIRVAEAQKRGAIHFHVILQIEERFLKKYRTRNGKWRIRDPQMRKLIQQYFLCDQITMVPVTDEGAAKYLAKYMSKDNNLEDNLKKQKSLPLDDEFVKQVLTVGATSLAGKRMVNISQGLKKKVKAKALAEQIEKNKGLLSENKSPDVRTDSGLDEESEQLGIKKTVVKRYLLCSAASGVPESLKWKSGTAKYDPTLQKTMIAKGRCIGCPGCKYLFTNEKAFLREKEWRLQAIKEFGEQDPRHSLNEMELSRTMNTYTQEKEDFKRLGYDWIPWDSIATELYQMCGHQIRMKEQIGKKYTRDIEHVLQDIIRKWATDHNCTEGDVMQGRSKLFENEQAPSAPAMRYGQEIDHIRNMARQATRERLAREKEAVISAGGMALGTEEERQKRDDELREHNRKMKRFREMEENYNLDLLLDKTA